jgi:hypothetical protein
MTANTSSVFSQSNLFRGTRRKSKEHKILGLDVSTMKGLGQGALEKSKKEKSIDTQQRRMTANPPPKKKESRKRTMCQQ